jgi:hypothetical protein
MVSKTPDQWENTGDFRTALSKEIEKQITRKDKRKGSWKLCLRDENISVKTAIGFNEGPGMIEQLRELATADPFQPFTIEMGDERSFHVDQAQEIEFTHYGSPKVKTGSNSWAILNIDQIVAIHLTKRKRPSRQIRPRKL